MFSTIVLISFLSGGVVYGIDNMGPYETEGQCKERGAEIVLDIAKKKMVDMDDVRSIETICDKVVKPDVPA